MNDTELFSFPIIEGFLIGGGLIMAIGAQNAFVIRQGIKRQHLLLTALTCLFCDVLLIILGVMGTGLLFQDIPHLEIIFRWIGGLFLCAYGLKSFYQVFHPHKLDPAQEPLKSTWQATLLTLLAFTFLNPHTYLDTLFLLGTVGGERPPEEHWPFILGATMASTVWFFGLTYGASALSPLFKKTRTWQILDTVTGLIMVGMGIQLIL